MSNITERMKQLREPFPADRIEWRIGTSGVKKDGSVWARCLAYIDNRAAMERLDEVYGEKWSHHEEFKQVGNSAVCVVTITLGEFSGTDYRSVTGTCEVEANGDIDPFKSAASGAMKRAVVNLGIGRYLYDLPEAWADISPNGKNSAKAKDKENNREVWYKWNPPSLPAWALPSGVKQEASSATTAVTAPAPAVSTRDEVPFEAPAKKPATVALSEIPGKFIPNPNYTNKGTDTKFIVPFGDKKGQPLSSLPVRAERGVKCGDLTYWAKSWVPKPFGSNTEPSKRDLDLKAEAQRLLALATGGSAPKPSAPAVAPAPVDDVPF